MAQFGSERNSHNLAVHTTRMMGGDLIRPNHTYH